MPEVRQHLAGGGPIWSSAVRPHRKTTLGLHQCVIMPAFVVTLLFGSSWPQGDSTANELPVETDREVSRLIEKLGHPNYATRRRAREHLERMGLQALDELHVAQYHPDSEIATAARFLASSLLINWSLDTDPPAVREALDEYGAQSETERQTRIDRLAELPRIQGLPALCRLVRFENSLRLSRQAALAIMRQPLGSDPKLLAGEAEVITEVLGPNDRRAAQWLRAYSSDLKSGEYSADTWRDLIRRQRHAIDEGNDINLTRPSVLELVRVCATRAASSGKRDEGLALATENLDLVPPRSREVIDACSWAIDNQMHPLVMKLKERYEDLFSRQPILLYGAAEALLTEGRDDEAERLATQAAAIQPLPEASSEAAGKLSPKVIEETAQRHREIGLELERRGLFRWAEREYRHIVDSLPVDSTISAIARRHLASMFGELQRHSEVVEILEPLVRRATDDQQYLRRLQSLYINVRELHSTMLFHEALDHIEQGEDEARETLTAAIEMAPDNADILIAMFRLDSDDAWRSQVVRRIEMLATVFENQIESLKLELQQRPRAIDAVQQLATNLNQYAWLISNTQGDFQKALRYSLHSLELMPEEPAFLDTCGRCYFSVGDIAGAIRTQKHAVRLMPHSPPLLRQLAEFERAAGDADDDAAASGPTDSVPAASGT